MGKDPSMKDEIKKIVCKYNSKSENLILILQEIQGRYYYLPEEVFPFVAEDLRMTESKIYGVATFYTQFKFIKPGKHQIKVCMGTACHVKGSDSLLDIVETTLGISCGETTRDGMFSLDRVACLGCCALSPVVTVDSEVHGKMTRPKLVSLLNELKKEREK